MTIRRLATLAAAAAALAVGAPAGADTLPQGGGANNVVIVKTGTDGASPVRAHTQVAQTASPTVTSSNVATATATGCTGCHATAVAVQVLMVTDAPQYFTPRNAAAAVNSGCTRCGTFAYAWQYVVQVDGPARLSASGRAEVQELEQQIADASGSVVPATLADDLALQAKLDGLTSRLRAVIDAEVEQGNVSLVRGPAVHKRVSFDEPS